MKTYIVSYDLISEKDYENLIKEIKSFTTWAKPLRSFWLVKTNETASAIRDRLKEVMDNDDKLVVIEAGNWWATRNISDDVTEWMKKHI